MTHATAELSATSNSRPFSLLVVSPDRKLLRQLARFLDVFGYHTRQAADVNQAIAAAQCGPVDFLIADALTPVPPGTQLCKLVRAQARGGYTYSLLALADPTVQQVTEALEAGFDDFLARPIVFGELLARLRAGARVIEFERRLATQSGCDPVTKLPDRSLLAKFLAQPIPAPFTQRFLAILDLDSFSRVPRNAGAEASHLLLPIIAERLCSLAPSGSFVASLGDDHFAVTLDTTSEHDAIAAAQKMIDALAAETFTIGTSTVHLTTSCGLVEHRASQQSADATLEMAESSLDLAKSSGGNCVCTYREVDHDEEAWAELAAAGRLFETTLARDVMSPCPLLVHLDETLDQAQAMINLTRLSAAVVVDSEGRLAGLLTQDQLTALDPRPTGKPRGGSSTRLVRHLMTSDVPKFDERATLAELLEFFTGNSSPLTVIVSEKKPTGIVFCQALAALNERLTSSHFAPLQSITETSDYLLVPDLCHADTSC